MHSPGCSVLATVSRNELIHTVCDRQL